jgi:hypothetical protein
MHSCPSTPAAAGRLRAKSRALTKNEARGRGDMKRCDALSEVSVEAVVPQGRTSD